MCCNFCQQNSKRRYICSPIRTNNIFETYPFIMATLTRTSTQPQKQALNPILTSVPAPFPRELLHQDVAQPEIRVEAPEVEAGPSRTLPASESNSTVVLVCALHFSQHRPGLMPCAAGANTINCLRRKDMSHDAKQPAVRAHKVESYRSRSKAFDAFVAGDIHGSADGIPVFFCAADPCVQPSQSGSP
jgi:hypothetical protein